ncbi:hypothetical protein KP004_18780 [Geomonas oryzisoli]|uniref:Histidine phosphatase family protein n=1 Tax=Geomonas oryzisoli TaxID=2847992 RepID=A0ABX8J428_9BACT|nr:hypothetical protein [Geomonas oryzisoli]QWV93188.1 hypothetical protein KP004_18780 [Geomonas oryzisoli]
MRKMPVVMSLLLYLAMVLSVGGCGSASSSPQPLDADHTNLIFVVSPDLAYHESGDVAADTANLTSQGLHRSLLLASYLKQQVLGGGNVTGIYALEPMTHLQTAYGYPDMAPLGFIQQFALLNQTTLPIDQNGTTYTGNTYPIKASYGQGQVPDGVVPPTAPLPILPRYSPDSTGLDFHNAGAANEALAYSIIDNRRTGYFVFSAPWETVNALLRSINTRYGYRLALPAAYQGSNYIHAISIPPTGAARLLTYNSRVKPSSSYPVLPAPVATVACTDSPLSYSRVAGQNGVTVPAHMNTNATVYIVRHAEAHPGPGARFDNGNYVGAGQWRALSLANALKDKITRPDMIYSIDPAGTWYPNGAMNVSYIRPSLTVLPYAIANNLPYHLASTFSLGSAFTPTDDTVAEATKDFFFTGGTFSNKTVLVAWESGHIKPFLKKLIESYGGNYAALPDGWTDWLSTDYDTIWTVRLDAQGNLSVDNANCEGIDSASLPAAAPLF